MSRIERYPSMQDASHRACELVRQAAEQARAAKGWFSLAISGGSTPRRFLSMLSQTEYIGWKNIHVFLVDERLVSEQSPDSNLGQAKELFLKKVPIPQEQIHAPSTSLPFEQSAKEYEERIWGVFDQDFPELDIIHLGMGSDGHTASLFPQSTQLEENSRLVSGVPARGSPALPRVSMTLPLINASRIVFFLLQGEQKSSLVQQIKAGQRNLPAAQVLPKNELYWLLAS